MSQKSVVKEFYERLFYKSQKSKITEIELI